MKSLILKDLYNLSHNAKSMCFILLFFAVCFIPSSGMQSYLCVCAALCSMMIVTSFSFDEHSGWTSYAMIMPVSRKELIAGKYIALFIFSIIGVISGFIIGTAGSRIASFFVPSTDNVAAMPLLLTAIIALALSNVLGGIAIPLVLKFGTEKARLLILVSFFIPSAIGYISYSFLTSIGIAITDGLLSAFLYCSPLAALIWNYILYKISCYIFACKEF